MENQTIFWVGISNLLAIHSFFCLEQAYWPLKKRLKTNEHRYYKEF